MVQRIKTGMIADGAVTTAKMNDEVENLFSFRNFIINGSMSVWQRGTSLPYNTGGAFFGPADRFWFYSNSGASSGTLERSTDVPSNSGLTYSLFNNTNATFASGTNVELTRQGDYAPFKTGQPYTLSMWIKGSSATSMSLGITWRNAHASGANSVTIDTSQSFPVTTSWVRTSITFTPTANIDANNLVLDFEWQMPAGCKITGVQLEEGSIPTPFERRPYTTELQLCQRYYERWTGSRLTFGRHTSPGQYRTMLVWFPVIKRATPTVTTTYNHGGLTTSGSQDILPDTGGFTQYINYTTDSGASSELTIYTASAEL